jgi:predicted PhzF superfamily epimerase YddE/YHI9
MRKALPIHFRLYQVDSFTSRIFKGNPAGVCVLNEDMTDEMEQDIASEMNCPEHVEASAFTLFF